MEILRRRRRKSEVPIVLSLISPFVLPTSSLKNPCDLMRMTTRELTRRFHCAALVCGHVAALALLLGLSSGCITKKTVSENPSDLTKLPMEILMTIPVRNKPSPEASRKSGQLANAGDSELRLSAGSHSRGNGGWQC